MAELWFHCGSCGCFGEESELLPDDGPQPHPCGKDKCPRCGAVGCIACCLTDADIAERGAVEAGIIYPPGPSDEPQQPSPLPPPDRPR